jgi:hypothetical protein
MLATKKENIVSSKLQFCKNCMYFGGFFVEITCGVLFINYIYFESVGIQ